MDDCRAVICGMGTVSPYGDGVACLWDNVISGNCAMRPISRFDASGYRSSLGGEVPEAVSGKYGENLALGFALAAAREAINDAGYSGESLGIILGSNFQGMSAFQQAAKDLSDKKDKVSLNGYCGDDILEAIRKEVGGQGPQQLLSLACASGTAVLGVALEWLRSGMCDAVLAGGFDELNESAIAGLSNLRAISAEGSVKPFDVNRGGTLFSEGAGMFLLRKDAENGYAQVLGRGLNNDAFHMTAPEKEGRGIIRCMRMALADAGLSPEKIGHFNAHGTATKYNDMIETAALHSVFGARAAEIPLAANKSLFGHAMGAAGSLEGIVACLSLSKCIIPPTINCTEPDPELKVNLIRDKFIEAELQYVMSNSYGLGGANASIILGAVNNSKT